MKEIRIFYDQDADSYWAVVDINVSGSTTTVQRCSFSPVDALYELEAAMIEITSVEAK